MKFIIIQTVSQLPKKIINTQNILCHTKKFLLPSSLCHPVAEAHYYGTTTQPDGESQPF